MLVPNLEALYKLTSLINEEFKGKNLSNMTLIFEVDEKTLNRVNEDFFYRNNPNATHDDYETVDEVNVNIEGIKYKYIKKIGD